MPIYQRDENMAPDSDFEPGELSHLVAGNAARLLDPRRTPVTVVDLRVPTGTFVVRLEAFEDRGALWEIPVERVGHYQFARGQARAAARVVAELERAVERLDRPLHVSADGATGNRTRARLDTVRAEAADWLDRHSRFFAGPATLPDPSTRAGEPRLAADLRVYLGEHDLDRMEAAFARQFVSNPHSGEMVKGHRLVLAELGLVPFEDRVVRDPGLFDGDWSRARRAEHLVRRLAFVQAVFHKLGHESVRLYRGLSTEDELRPPENRTFVSATFDPAVAKAHFHAAGDDSNGLLYRLAVPIERVFMTYLETEEMNEPFREAEAVLLYRETALGF